LVVKAVRVELRRSASNRRAGASGGRHDGAPRGSRIATGAPIAGHRQEVAMPIRVEQPADQPAQAMPSEAPMAPGDEAPEGTPGTGPTVCPSCGGSGRVAAGLCPECEGTGQVNVGIGGA
jgi:hypothetical protein